MPETGVIGNEGEGILVSEDWGDMSSITSCATLFRIERPLAFFRDRFLTDLDSGGGPFSLSSSAIWKKINCSSGESLFHIFPHSRDISCWPVFSGKKPPCMRNER